ncbi:hypothetical protein JOD55_001269 [Arcanobacterium pluranimalium]|uniref:hypothetical protein n=1 Tax=Arcanobacterium pluranimalium TaxID=108028 RepID=UPI00195A9842|nr:hypothetical protein [Arcanobacterium pluranimalium]MBM7825442.1 hypothetical protein [Arcanobacterium pluranimalium]
MKNHTVSSATLGVFRPEILALFCAASYLLCLGIGMYGGWTFLEASILGAVFVPLFVNAVVDFCTFRLVVAWSQLALAITCIWISYQVYVGLQVKNLAVSMFLGFASVILVCLPALLQRNGLHRGSEFFLGSGDIRLLLLLAVLMASEQQLWILPVIFFSSLCALVVFGVNRFCEARIPGVNGFRLAFGPIIILCAWIVMYIAVPITRLT